MNSLMYILLQHKLKGFWSPQYKIFLGEENGKLQLKLIFPTLFKVKDTKYQENKLIMRIKHKQKVPWYITQPNYIHMKFYNAV